MAFSPDGRHAISGAGDGTVRLWEVATGREVRRFSGHDKGVHDVAFSPDGRQALTVGEDTMVASVEPTVRAKVQDALRLAVKPERLHCFDAQTEVAV